MKKKRLPKSFIDRCKAVTAKRPRTVIEHILKHGHVTTQELKDEYGYNHPPRAARDVREQGIPLETFQVTGADGRSIGAYRFGDPSDARFTRLHGRTAFSKELKKSLIERNGARCTIYLERFPEAELQIDHRVPFEIGGDAADLDQDPEKYMLLCGSANRAKSWSCEHCANWNELRKPDICNRCYWAFPNDYDHIALRPIRRLDIVWQENEVHVYDRLRQVTEELQKDMPDYVKEIIKAHMKEG